jgi:hypothetical protein
MKKTIYTNNKIGFLLFLFALSVIGSALIYYATIWGPWAFSDSAAYISGAKNFNDGLGVSVISAEGILEPLTVFPPIYSLSLSAIANFGLDYLTAARILDVLLFGLLIFVFSWGLLTLTNNFWLTVISSLLVLFSPVMLNNFSGVMTEPLFITLFYTSFFFTLIYIQKQKPYLFVLAVLFTCISPFIRYIGIFTCAVNVLLILFFDNSVVKKKFGKGVLFGFFSSLPILLWSIYTYINNHSLGTRTIIQPSDLAAKFLTFLKDIGVIFQSWLPYMQYRIDLIPDLLKTAVFVIGIIMLFVSGLCFYMKRKRQTQTNPVLQVMLASFLTIIIYLFVLCVIYLFSIPQPDIISRMLSPLLPSLALLLGTAVIFFLEQVPTRWKTYAIVFMTILMVLLIRYYFLRTTAISRNLNENGYGFTAKEIQISGFLKAVQSLPTETPLIANTPAMTLFYTNRMPYFVDYIPTNTFGTRDSNAEQLFNTQHAALILEFAPIRNVYSDWEARLASFTHGLTIAYKDDIGGIYYSPSGTTP